MIDINEQIILNEIQEEISDICKKIGKFLMKNNMSVSQSVLCMSIMIKGIFEDAETRLKQNFDLLDNLSNFIAAGIQYEVIHRINKKLN